MPDVEARSAFLIESLWSLDATIEEIVAIIAEPLSLGSWWSAVFMKSEMLEPGGDDLVGLTARFYTKGLLPHTFQFTAQVVGGTPGRELEIRTWGDFDGRGLVRMRPTDRGADVEIRWKVIVRQPYIRPLLRLAKPIFVANHRWAMRRGREGLQAEILRRRKTEDAVAGRRQMPTFPHNLDSVQRSFRWTRDELRCDS